MVSLVDLIKKIRRDRPRCKSCGSNLVKGDGDVLVGLYDHGGGFKINGLTNKQWVSVRCHDCNYDNSMYPTAHPYREARDPDLPRGFASWRQWQQTADMEEREAARRREW